MARRENATGEPTGRLAALGGGRRRAARHRLERVETALIVALAMLVVIKGSGAIGGVIAGIGQMVVAVLGW